MKDQMKGPRAYIVSVLWLHGNSTGEIAKAVRWTPGQVRGHVNRHCKPAREHMSKKMRQSRLNRLKETRQDNGALRDEHFIAIDLQTKVPDSAKNAAAINRSWVAALAIDYGIEDGERRAKSEQGTNAEHRRRLCLSVKDGGLGVDPSTKDGRRLLKDFATAAQREARAAADGRRDRSAGGATQRGVNAAALEYLHAHRLLRDQGSNRDVGKTPEEMRRLEAGLQLRRYLEASRLGGLGAMDYGRVSGGGSGGMALSAYKMQCIQALGRIRQQMSKEEFLTIEAVVDQDAMIWEMEPPESRARSAIYAAIRRLLDAVSVAERMMSRRAFEDLWEPEPEAVAKEVVS